jgi:GMP synthase-like glutamine amidotransferase
LKVTARTAEGIVMALSHQSWPVYGVQFHPESILTEGGYKMLVNFLRLAGLAEPDRLPGIHDERPVRAPEARLPAAPVTF